MIIESIFDFLVSLLETAFGWISLPAFPEQLANTLETFENLMFDNLSMLSFFVRVSTVKIILPLVLVVTNFDKLYKLTMFVLRKIPFVGIK